MNLPTNEHTLSFQLDSSPIPGHEGVNPTPKFHVFLGDKKIGALSRCIIATDSDWMLPKVELHFCRGLDKAQYDQLSQEARDQIETWVNALKGILGVVITHP